MAFFRKSVVHARGNFVVGFAQDDAVGDEEFQRGGENRVGDVAHLRAQFAVTRHVQRGEHADDAGLHLPPKSSMPYSRGQKMSFSCLR